MQFQGVWALLLGPVFLNGAGARIRDSEAGRLGHTRGPAG